MTDVATIGSPALALTSSGGQLTFDLTSVANPKPSWWNKSSVVQVSLLIPKSASNANANASAGAAAPAAADGNNGGGGTSVALAGGSTLVYFATTNEENLTIPNTYNYSPAAAGAAATMTGMLALSINGSNDLFFQAFPAMAKTDGSVSCTFTGAGTMANAKIKVDSSKPRAVSLSVDMSTLGSLLPAANQNPAPTFALTLGLTGTGTTLVLPKLQNSAAPPTNTIQLTPAVAVPAPVSTPAPTSTPKSSGGGGK